MNKPICPDIRSFFSSIKIPQEDVLKKSGLGNLESLVEGKEKTNGLETFIDTKYRNHNLRSFGIKDYKRNSSEHSRNLPVMISENIRDTAVRKHSSGEVNLNFCRLSTKRKRSRSRYKEEGQSLKRSKMVIGVANNIGDLLLNSKAVLLEDQSGEIESFEERRDRVPPHSGTARLEIENPGDRNWNLSEN